jgi:hypothetical protein
MESPGKRLEQVHGVREGLQRIRGACMWLPLRGRHVGRVVCYTMYLCLHAGLFLGQTVWLRLSSFSADPEMDHGQLRPQPSAVCREIPTGMLNECVCSACADASRPQELQREAEELVGAEGANVEEVSAQKAQNACTLAAARRIFSSLWIVSSSTLEAAFMEHPCVRRVCVF